MSTLQDKLPPTFSDTSPVLNGIALTRDPLAFFVRLARDAGDFAHYVLNDRVVYFVNDPELVREIIVTHDQSFPKWAFNDSFSKIFGTGLIGSHGDLHRKMRKVARPPLQTDRLPGYVRAIVELTERRERSWSDGKIDLGHEMTLLTLEVIGQTLFSISLGERAQKIAELTQTLLRLNTKLGGAPEDISDFEKANTELTEMSQALIDEHAARPPDDSLLSTLIAVQRAGLISEHQLRQEIRTFILAGHVTTAQSIACAFWLLARDPALEEKLHKEVDQVLGGRMPGLEDVPRLAFCHMVMLETLRLYPPVWVFGRHALQDVSLGGYTLPKGCDLVLVCWLLHRNPELFPEPETFRPQRWENDLRSRLPHCAYLPFSIGQRGCLGEQFALLESVLVLASIAQRWKFRELPGSPDPAWSAQLLYWPRRGIHLQAESRS